VRLDGAAVGYRGSGSEGNVSPVPSDVPKLVLSRGASGSSGFGRMTPNLSTGVASNSSTDVERAFQRRKTDDEASANVNKSRRSSEIRRLEVRRASLSSPCELLENQEEADIRLAQARDHISYVADLTLPGFARRDAGTVSWWRLV
jgi:hypothetical protein